MSDWYPTDLKLAPDGSLSIVWSDGVVHEITPRALRSSCPCARCRAESLQPPKPKSAFPLLSSAEARPLAIERMVPVGNYAYNIEFSDGHSTGIYSFEFLRQIGASTNSPSP